MKCSKAKRGFGLMGNNGPDRDAEILMTNLPGDISEEEIKKMFKGMRGNIYLDLRSDKGRQSKDKDLSWTRTCHANIRCSEVATAIKAKESFDGKVMRRGHQIQCDIKHLRDDVWFELTNEGANMDIYVLNISYYEWLSIVIEYDTNKYFISAFSHKFDSLKRIVCDSKLIFVIPPSINNDKYAENNALIQYHKICTFKRNNYARMSYDTIINEREGIPQLLMYREVNILAEHNHSFLYLLPFAIDNSLSDMLSSMDLECDCDCDINKAKNSVSVLCSQGPMGTFSHSKGGYKHSYDFATCIGTPVIAPRDGIIVDLVDHHKKHGTDLCYEKKCNYVTLLFADGSQCDIVHLRYKSIQCKKGDYVKMGDLIAYSGNTGFSAEPHIHLMVYLNRLVGDTVHWQSIAIKFRNPCTDHSGFKPIPGQRYTQYLRNYCLDPLLIATDRVQCSVESNHCWNEIDYTPITHSRKSVRDSDSARIEISQSINELLFYQISDVSTLQCDMIIVPLSLKNIMNNWLICRVLRRGGTKLMSQLMRRGYDLLYTTGHKQQSTTAKHSIRKYDNLSQNIVILSGYDQLPNKKIMFVITGTDTSQVLSEDLMHSVFEYLLLHPISTIALELPVFNGFNDRIDKELQCIRAGLEKYLRSNNNVLNSALKQMTQFFVCAQSLHDLHCYSPYIAKWFPRMPSPSRLECKYVPHCPCNTCIDKEFGLGKLYQKHKISLHQKGIEDDTCSGIESEHLLLTNVLKCGQMTPLCSRPSMPIMPLPNIIPMTKKRKKLVLSIEDSKQCSESVSPTHKRRKIDLSEVKFDFEKVSHENIFKLGQTNNDSPKFDYNSSHMLSLIGQQRQLDLHHKRLLIYQRFKEWKCVSEKTNPSLLKAENKSELQRLHILRSMQYKQQIQFQKSKQNNSMIISPKYGVVGSAEHMNCIPLTPQIPANIPKLPNILNMSGAQMKNVRKDKIAPMAYIINCVTPKRAYYTPTHGNINLSDCGFAAMAVQKELSARESMKAQQKQQKVNADNFAKIQNIIAMIVKNKMSFCGGKIKSTEHAIHHVTNCTKCMATLEKFKGTVFK